RASTPLHSFPTRRSSDLFSNPALHHRCAQIAMDGSQKLPQRVLTPIRERLEYGQGVRLLSLTVAAWLAYVARTIGDDPSGLSDPDRKSTRLNSSHVKSSY